MTTIVTDGALAPDDGDDGHRPSAVAAWTDEQTAYALFLQNACVRLEVVAIEMGIERYLVDDFVRDALVTIHRARHTRARGQQGDAWIEAIAHNLGRKRRWGAAMRGRRRTILRSLWPFVRAYRHRGGYVEARRRISAVLPAVTTM